jgi:hypothetical protein
MSSVVKDAFKAWVDEFSSAGLSIESETDEEITARGPNGTVSLKFDGSTWRVESDNPQYAKAAEKYYQMYMYVWREICRALAWIEVR